MTITVRVSKTTHRTLKEMAEKTGKSIKGHAEEALDFYLKKILPDQLKQVQRLKKSVENAKKGNVAKLPTKWMK